MTDAGHGRRRHDRAIALVQAYYDAFNRADWDGMLAVLGDDVVHDLNQGPREVGREAFTAFLRRMQASYREQLQDIVLMATPDGDRVAAEYVVHGEYLASDAGLPEARGQRYVLAGGTVSAQSGGLQDWGFDPSVLAADGRDLLQRAPDPAVDGLFQAVHAASRVPGDADVLCALFEPAADRSLEGLNAAAARLSPASQDRLLLATADVLLAASQSPPRPFDADAARQALKSNLARAAILHDGFAAGLVVDGVDAASREARCRALGWILDTLQARPLAERAQVTRLLLDEGLQRMAMPVADD